MNQAVDRPEPPVEVSSQAEAEPGTGLGAGLAAAISASALVVPMLLSLSTTPTPNHPRVFLWYRTLRQPAFKPPDVAIPVAWTVIESFLAAGAYRLLRKPSSPARNRSLALLAGNVVAIGAWSRLFFGRRNLPASTVAAAALIGTGAAYVAQAKKVDTPAAAAGLPLTAWVAFATVLTAAIWRLNR
ncbi:MAG: TspO/MBR family protein [Solirubrobacteraceae bacterium]|nr:TspO/MBR family protein [Solirubrobacteraceae bacterium]